jgi:hypothetical protein
MKPSQFWHFGSPEETSKLAQWANEEVDLEGVICPADDGHQRAGKRLTDLSVTLPGDRCTDIVWTWYNECLLTDRALQLFQAYNFSGFEVKPVKAVFKTRMKEPPRLWELIVTGWAGMAPPESGIHLIEHCEACGHKQYSAWTVPERLIDPSQWDGSDFFMVWPLSGHIFITDRVRRAIYEQALTGMELKPARDLIFPEILPPTISPGRLSYWMPEQRARTLGEPLGIY